MIIIKTVERKVSEFEGGNVATVIGELLKMIPVPREQAMKCQLLHLFQIAFKPGEKWLSSDGVTKDVLDEHDPLNEFVLRKKLGKLDDELYQICRELCNFYPTISLEKESGSALYVFLRKRMRKKQPKFTAPRLYS